jgi:hypothetical protein
VRRPAPWNTSPGQIRALPAMITDRAGRFRRTRVRLTCAGVPGIHTFAGHGPDTLGHGGLDLRTTMFARMSRYGPVTGGTTRYPVSRLSIQTGRSQHFPALSDTA